MNLVDADEIYHRFGRYEWEEISDTMKKSILEAINEALRQPVVIGSVRYEKLRQKPIVIIGEPKPCAKKIDEQCFSHGVSNRTYFGKVCKWCKSTKTHYDYVTIEGNEVWQCDNCSQEFLCDY